MPTLSVIVSKYLEEIIKALLNNHLKDIYDRLSNQQAEILV